MTDRVSLHQAEMRNNITYTELRTSNGARSILFMVSIRSHPNQEARCRHWRFKPVADLNHYGC